MLVPYVPTPIPVIDAMLNAVNANSEDIVYDLGCGDGRILFRAVEKFGVKKAVGIEIRKELVEATLGKIRKKGLEEKIRIIHGNFFDIPISEATVVTLFLLTTVNKMLRPKLEKELRKGARVVSHEFEIPGWEPDKVTVIHDGILTHKIYAYLR
jgi:ubiquinone/menaquinone biosynthesis C-methylase UbiE